MLESPQSPARCALAGPSTPRRKPSSTSSRRQRDHRPSPSVQRRQEEMIANNVTETLQYCVELGTGEASNTLDVSVSNIKGDTISPRWIRRRTLSAQDEIVDMLNDAQAQNITWALHRPTRGWYMHIRAPAFPPGVVLDIQPLASKRSIVQSCKVQDLLDGMPLLLTISTRLRDEHLKQLKDRVVEPDISTASSHGKGHSTHYDKHDFTSIMLESPGPGEHDVSSNTSTPARTSARDDLHLGRGHTRRRSAGVNGTSPAHRSTSSMSRRAETTDTVMELPEEADAADVGLARRTKILPERPHAQEDSSAARNCHIVIAEHRGPATTTDGASVQSASWLSWARYALVEGLQSSGMATRGGGFSIWWIDAPSEATDAEQKVRRIELLRFEDESSWWHWSASRRGRILVQQAATAALNIDIGLWIALALGYLDFLDERNGYNAAADGG